MSTRGNDARRRVHRPSLASLSGCPYSSTRTYCCGTRARSALVLLLGGNWRGRGRLIIQSSCSHSHRHRAREAHEQRRGRRGRATSRLRVIDMLLGRACRAHWHRLRSPALGRAISSAKSPATPPASSSVRSPSGRAALESQLLSKLAEVLDPSLVSVSGLVVRPSGHVACTLDFYSGATPDRAALEAAAAAALRAAVPADVAAEEDGVIVASRDRKSVV